VTRANRLWFSFGGAPHVAIALSPAVSWCGRDLTNATPAPHPATWRDACVHCKTEIERAERVPEGSAA
jgi:hypothetical protein